MLILPDIQIRYIGDEGKQNYAMRVAQETRTSTLQAVIDWLSHHACIDVQGDLQYFAITPKEMDELKSLTEGTQSK